MKENIIAIVYDFDKTLSRRDMQEDTIFRQYGIKSDDFWAKTQEMTRSKGYERILAYLRLLMHEAPFVEKPFTRNSLRDMASDVEYYPGVESYFPMIDRFVEENSHTERLGIKLEHYLISSGLKEIIEGTSIYHHFKKVYACEFDYEDGRPVFPKLVINDTNKTQFIFRINKGMLELTEDINSHTPLEDRRIPFRNILYIGDGLSDVPSMAVTTKNGGYAIAVCDERGDNLEVVSSLVKEKRASHMAVANFEEGSHLVNIIKLIVEHMIYNIRYEVSAKRNYDRAKLKLSP